MRLLFRTTDVTRRRLLAVLVVIGQLFGAVGVIPVRANPTANHSSISYPCQNHRCGCLTAEECWAGPCCCFTMQEKVAWAAERGIRPPVHAIRLAEEEVAPKRLSQEEHPPTDAGCAKCRENAPPKYMGSDCSSDSDVCPQSGSTNHKSCCEETQTTPPSQAHRLPEPEPRSTAWVIGMFAQKCRGEGPGGLLKLDPSVPPASLGRNLFAPIPLSDILALQLSVTSNSPPPPTRPPRKS
jgi:hypothetical protein